MRDVQGLFREARRAFQRRARSLGGGAWVECDSMRGIRGPSKSGGGRLANNEATPYNLLRCPTPGPQVARESGTAGKPRENAGGVSRLTGARPQSRKVADVHRSASGAQLAQVREFSVSRRGGGKAVASAADRGPSRDFRPVEEWEDVFRRNLGPRLSAAGLSVEVFIWNDFHDRYLISNLAGLSLPSGFDTTSAKDKTTWSRLGRSDRDDIQREFDPASNRHGLKHRFTIP